MGRSCEPDVGGYIHSFSNMSQAVQLSISVVVYHPDLEILRRSLASLRVAIQYAAARRPLLASVVVVDNSCDPGEAAPIGEVIADALDGVPAELLVSETNAGYGAGNNMVIRKCSSDYHLVANPDIFLDPDALFIACAYMDANADVALLSPAVRGEDGEMHYLCKRNPTLLVMFLRGAAPPFVRSLLGGVIQRYEMRDRDYAQEIRHVPFPTGCFMFFRTAPLQQIGGFDEAFFLYYEDADVARRISTLGRVSYVPSVRIVHRWGRGTHRRRRLWWATVKSGILYWRKWGGVFRATGADR